MTVALACVEAGICSLFLSVPKQPLFDVGKEQRRRKAESAPQPQSSMGEQGPNVAPYTLSCTGRG